MCGIAGIVSLVSRPVDAGRIKPMCDAIAHRGPDDAGYSMFRVGSSRGGDGGYWCSFTEDEFRHVNEQLPVFGGRYFRDELAGGDFSLVLGHRRLSIIDLSHYGHQPMASSDRRYWITFNGEIYNFRELREQLRGAGHTFRSRSDTEVILHLWDEYGSDCLSMLDGMFAFALYDRVENVLSLARDRFGVKPLYYVISGDFLVFGSEIKAILASGTVDPAIDPESLVEYFTFQNTYGSHTLFQGVRLLQPGELATVRPGSGQKPRVRRFHDRFPTADMSLMEPGPAAELITEAFTQAVGRQLVSDVDVGAYLSGGMDSGSIVAVAGRSIPRLLTFTGGFDLTNVNGIEQGFDERKQAEHLSHLLQTEHYDVVLHSGDMPAAMEQISWHLDDPRVGMCHQNWYVAKLASRFVKVCLAGAGGDELFAGYPWRYRHGLGAQSFEEFDQHYFAYWHRLLPRGEVPRLFSPDLRPCYSAPWGRFQQVMSHAPGYQQELSLQDNLLQRALYFEFKTFMHGFLIVEDRLSMAHSLETRVPFLDNQLADLAWRLPPSLKIHGAGLAGASLDVPLQTAEGKRILRQAMEALLPVEFTQQRKQGFSPPDENWYRGPSMDYIKEILYDAQTLDRPWFDQAFVGNSLEQHFEGRQNHRLLIWSLLIFEWIQRHFTDAAAAAQQPKAA